MERRPIKARASQWAQSLAKLLANANISPNSISIIGIFFALGAGICMYLVSIDFPPYLLLIAATLIPLRLLCNLMDGMVAVEYNRQSITGDIFNDVPDRIADLLIIAGAGFAACGFLSNELGFLAGAIAIMIAYIRLLGATLVNKQFFVGPLAKQQRMTTIIIACILDFINMQFNLMNISFLYIGIRIIIIGGIITIIIRLNYIINLLKRKSK